MNVLSIFDGISCGQLALNRAGIEYENYYASEIDKFAIKVTQNNYPDTIQVGNVTELDVSTLPHINLLIGGSPCQGFSFAGKQLNFDDPRSKLFFEYVRILDEIRKYNPGVTFLLENVKMAKRHEEVINKTLGVKPIRLNSSLVSAQNRQRLYWTNIKVKDIPENTYTFLHDVVEGGEVDRAKSYAIDSNYFKGGSYKNYLEKSRRQVVLTQSERRLIVHNLQPRSGKGQGGKGHLFKETGKTYSLDTQNKQAIQDERQVRKLTPEECEVLQTIPKGYTDCVSATQRYKMIGNGWTIDIVAFILSFMPKMEYA